MRETIIQEFGHYQGILKIGDKQRMTFTEDDNGPIYLNNSHRIQKKYDRSKGIKKVVEKSKKN